MGRQLTIIAVAAIFLMAQPASAQESGQAQNAADQPPQPGSIYGTVWGMTLAQDGSGFYNDILHLVLQESTTGKPYRPLPYRRAKVAFAADHGGCLYPSDLDHLKGGGELDDLSGYVQTRSLVWVESHLFSRPGQPPLESFAGLKGKAIAYPNGSALPTVLAGYDARFMPTTDETTKARMLIAGRVDYMSGSLPDNVFVFKAMGAPLPPYNPDLALIRVGVGIVCRATEANRAFVAAFDAALDRLSQSGQMQALFRDAGVEARFLPAP